jgi:hypothetical protein
MLLTFDLLLVAENERALLLDRFNAWDERLVASESSIGICQSGSQPFEFYCFLVGLLGYLPSSSMTTPPTSNPTDLNSFTPSPSDCSAHARINRNPTAIQLQSNCNPTAIQLQSNCNPTAIQLQSNCNPTAIQLSNF